MIKETFNHESFINVSDYDSMESLVKYIKYVDENDEKYLDIISKPVFVNSNHGRDKQRELIAFFRNIFEQDKKQAFRRNLGYRGMVYEKGFLDTDSSGFIGKLKRVFRG